LKQRLLAAAVTGWILLPVSAAGDSEVKNLLSSLKKKVLLLKQPAAGNHLHFDTRGLMVAGETGKANLYGWLEVTNAKLRKDKLQLETNRLIEIYDPRNQKLIQYRSGQVRIDAVVSNPSAAAVREVLAKIFVPPDAQAAPVIPDVDEKGKTRGEPGELRTLSNGEQVYKPGGAVTPPKIIDARDPEYSDHARQVGFNGSLELWIVIDEKGTVKHSVVTRPVGYGLEVQSINAVSTWKFDPATLNGQPVASQVMVEMNFRLTP
jgi:TonB family protein